jgi:hypothetical protein
MKNVFFFAVLLAISTYTTAQTLATSGNEPIFTKLDTAKPTDSVKVDSDTTKVVKTDTTKAKTAVAIKPKPALKELGMDTLFTMKGDTLIGLIELDKKKNNFYFTNLKTPKMELKTADVQGFAHFEPEKDNDKSEYFNIFNNFYRLESSKRGAIRIYASYKYKSRKASGETIYDVEKQYCLFKDGMPYFLNKNNTFEVLEKLTADCPTALVRLRNDKFFTGDEVAMIVNNYNQCMSAK